MGLCIKNQLIQPLKNPNPEDTQKQSVSKKKCSNVTFEITVFLELNKEKLNYFKNFIHVERFPNLNGLYEHKQNTQYSHQHN
jgi:hypothetical protein